MSEHYIVTLDQGHLRIYAERQQPGQMTPTLVQVEAMDFPAGKNSYTDRDTDMAGRFPGYRTGGSPDVGKVGMSIDERLPMQEEESRRRVRELAAVLEGFFEQRSEATWDFAAGPELNNAVLDALSAGIRGRLRRSVRKDLVNQRLEDVRAHFAES